MKKNIFNFILATLFGFLYSNSHAQCDVNSKYDNIISGYHSSVALTYDGKYEVWGSSMSATGAADLYAPKEINATNFTGLTGTVLKAAIGGQGGGTAVDQAVVLTTSGLWAWGVVGKVLGSSGTTTTVKSTAAFGRTSTNATYGFNTYGLPSTLVPTDIKSMFATYQTLVLLTNSGDVWMLTQTSLALESNGGTATTAGTSQWKRVKINSTTYLTNVTEVRGQVSNLTYNAFVAQNSSNQIYTWGNSSYLGNGTASAARNYATLMTLPTESGASITPKVIGVTGGISTTTTTKPTYYVLSTTGNIYSLGDNSQKQCGDFTTTEKTSWVQVKKSATVGDNLTNVVTFSAQESSAAYPGCAAVTVSGELYTWGNNSSGMLARSDNGHASSPTTNCPTCTLTTQATVNPGVTADISGKVINVELGGHTMLYLKEGTYQFCYVGHYTNGSMGDGGTGNNGTASATTLLLNCSSTPSISICGFIPTVASANNSTISASLTSIVANGSSTSTITVQLKDAAGTPLVTTGGTVLIYTSAGTLGTVIDNANGTYTAILTSSTNVENATLTFSVNGTLSTNSTNVSFRLPILTTGTLSNFSSCSGSISAFQSFVVSAMGLTNNLDITAPTGYELCLTSNGTYTNTLTITQSSGSVANTTIYVRLASNAIDGVSGSISITSTGVTSSSISVGTASVYPIPTIVTTSPNSRCGTGTVSLSAVPSSGSVNWYSVATNGTVLGTGLSFTTPSISTSTTYYAEAIDSGCISTTRTAVLATIVPISASGSITGAATVCPNTNSTTLTLNGSTGTIQWQSSTDNINFSNIVGATSTTYTSVNLSVATYYRVIVTNGTCSPATSASVVNSINTISAGSISGATTVCSGTNATVLTLTGNVGTIRWQSSSNNSTFTNLTNTGSTSSSYTVTNLLNSLYYRVTITNGSCTTNSSSVFMQADPTAVGGTVSSAQTICSGTSPSNLILTGNTGNVVKWQSATNSGFTAGLTDIANTSTTLTGTQIGSLTANTYFRAVLKSGVCTTTANSSSVLITVNALTVGGTVSSDQTICSGSSPASLSLAGYAGSIVKWQKATDALFTTPIDIVSTSATLTSATIGALTATTYFRAVVQSGVCSLAYSTNYVTISVSATTIGGTVSSDQTICTGSAPANLTLTGNNGNVVRWERSTSSTFSTSLITIASTSNTLSSATMGALTTGTYFYRSVVKNGSCLNTNSSNYVTISVSGNAAAGTVSGSATVCSGTNNSIITSSGTITTTRQWQSSTDNLTFTDISGQSGTTYTATNLTATTYFRVKAVNVACTAYSTSVTVTVTPVSLAGTISGASSVCTTTNTNTLTLTGNRGSIQWQSSTDNITFNNVTGQTSTTYTITNQPATRYYRVLVTNSICSAATSTSFAVTIDSNSVGGTTASAQTICSGTSPANITLSSQTGSVSKWQSATDAAFTTPVDLISTSTTLTGAVVGSLTSSTYLRGVVKNGSCASANSAAVLVTVNPGSVGGSISTNQSLCYGTTPSTLTLSGNNGTIVKWQRATDSAFTSTTDIAVTTATLSGSNLISTVGSTYYRAVVQYSSCPVAYSSYAVIAIYANSNGGTLTPNQTICSGTNPADITLSGNVGSVVKWQKATNSSFTTPIDISSTSNVLLGSTIGNLTQTTYFRAVVQNGACLSVNSASVVVTVNSITNAGTVASDEHVGYNTAPTSLILTGSNGAILYWQKALDATFTSPTTIYVTSNVLSDLQIGNLTESTYFRAIVQNGSCSASASTSILVTVDAMTEGGVAINNQSICYNSQPNDLQVTNNVGTVIRWEKDTVDTFPNPTTINSTSTTLTSAEIGNLTATTHFRAVVQNGLSAPDNSSHLTITVSPTTIGGSVSPDQSICTGSQPTDLNLSGHVGNVLKWQKDTNYTFSNPIDITSSNSVVLTSENIGILTTTTYFRAVVQSDNCSVAYSTYATITVSTPSIGGVVSNDQTVCSGTSPEAVSISNQTGNVIKWQSATDSAFNYPIDLSIAASTLQSNEIGNLSQTTYFRAVVQNGGCASVNSTNFVTISTNPISVGGSVSAPQTICYGNHPTTLNLSGYSGTIVKWQKATDALFTSPSDLNSITATLPGTSIGNLYETTYFRAVIKNGICNEAYSDYTTVTVIPLSVGGIVSSNQTICENTQPSDISLSNNVGSIVKWQSSSNVNFTNPTDITSTATVLSGAVIGNLASTTYFRAIVQNGTCSSSNSNYVTISTTSSIGGSVSSSQQICFGSAPSDLVLNGNNGNVIKWQKATDEFFTNPTDIASTSTTLSSVTIGNLTEITYFRAVVHNGTCSDAYSNSAIISIYETPVAGTVSGDQVICSGTQPTTDLILTGNVGTILKWQKSTDYLFSNPIDIANDSDTLTGVTIGNVFTTTFFRAVIQNGECTPVYSTFATVSIIATVWDGSTWSNGEPSDINITKSIVFTGNYTGAVNLYGCTMWVTNGANVVLNTGFNITTIGAITVDSGSTFVMENDSNILQLTDATNSGTVTVKRKSSPLFRLDYTLWSSPVLGSQTLFDFSPLTANVLPNNRRFYTYNTLTNLYNMVDPNQTTFGIGKGYLIRMPNNWIPFNGPDSLTPGTNLPARYNGSFVGTLNNGPYTVSGLVDGGSTDFRYNSVGNPYPSTIQIPEFISQNQNTIDGTIWLWRKTNDMYNSTSYSTCTSAGCTRNNGHTFYFDDNLISVGQGFMVRVKPNQSTLNFTNSMRIGDNVDQFFRTSQKNRFWLDTTNSSGIKYGQLMIAYVPNGTNNYDDGLDGVYINDSQTALTSVVEGKELTINARPLFDVTDVAPVQFRTDSGDNYTISINRTEGIFSGNQDILIRDNQLGITQSLKTGGYTFASTDGTFANRFDILYQNTTLTTNTPKFSEESVIVYKNQGSIHINAGATVIDNVKVFDIRGRLLVEKKKVNATQIALDSAAIGNQVLLVQITSDTQSVVTKKVMN